MPCDRGPLNAALLRLEPFRSAHSQPRRTHRQCSHRFLRLSRSRLARQFSNYQKRELAAAATAPGLLTMRRRPLGNDLVPFPRRAPQRQLDLAKLDLTATVVVAARPPRADARVSLM